MSLRLSVITRVQGDYVGPARGGVAATQSVDVLRRMVFFDADPSAPADRAYGVRATVAASGIVDLDLTGGLYDAFGASLAFAAVRAIYVAAAAGNAHDLLVGGAGASAFVGPMGAGDDRVRLKPGGVLLQASPAAAGWPAAPGASLLRLANAGSVSAITCDLVLIGVDAQALGAALDLRQPMNPFLVSFL